MTDFYKKWLVIVIYVSNYVLKAYFIIFANYRQKYLLNYYQVFKYSIQNTLVQNISFICKIEDSTDQIKSLT